MRPGGLAMLRPWPAVSLTPVSRRGRWLSWLAVAAQAGDFDRAEALASSITEPGEQARRWLSWLAWPRRRETLTAPGAGRAGDRRYWQAGRWVNWRARSRGRATLTTPRRWPA